MTTPVGINTSPFSPEATQEVRGEEIPTQHSEETSSVWCLGHFWQWITSSSPKIERNEQGNDTAVSDTVASLKSKTFFHTIHEFVFHSEKKKKQRSRPLTG